MGAVSRMTRMSLAVRQLSRVVYSIGDSVSNATYARERATGRSLSHCESSNSASSQTLQSFARLTFMNHVLIELPLAAHSVYTTVKILTSMAFLIYVGADMQQESLAAKASRKLKLPSTPMAKRSAPSLAEEQDMGAPAKAPRLDHPQQAASAGPAAAGASQALTARKPVNEMQREYRHLHGTGAPCKVTILHVTKYLGQVVAKTRPMVWQTNSAASSPAGELRAEYIPFTIETCMCACIN